MPDAAAERTLHIAIVGAGPSGFYAAEALLRSERPVTIDLIERLPTPYGLVRGGVAPDHQKTKGIAAALARIAAAPNVRFFGNAKVGVDIGIDELRRRCDAVVLACGADQSVRLGVAGEDLDGVHGSAEFVGWYNAHPDHQALEVDLACDRALVVGHGNVALDVCRILASPVERLASTDIAGHALRALARSRIAEIHVIGRRGPAQASFTTAELRELGTLPGWDVVVDASELELSAVSQAELESPGGNVRRNNLAVLREFSTRPRRHARHIRIGFGAAPLAFEGDERVQGARIGRFRLDGAPHRQVAVHDGSHIDRPCGLVVTCVGYRGHGLEGLPFDARRGVFPNESGRLVEGGKTVPGMYVAGWVKRGASGVIGTNRADSAATIDSMLEDWPALCAQPPVSRDAVAELLDARGVRVVSLEDWLRIDAREVDAGRKAGKPRDKLATIDALLAAAGAPVAS